MSLSEKYKQKFTGTVKAVHEKLGRKPFHVYRGINAAVLDSVMVAFARNTDYPADIRQRFNNLLERNILL